MREFVYYSKNGLDIPLNDEIYILSEKTHEECLIGNTKDANALLVAPEIDFYLENSKDSFIDKAQNITTLYEARAICFDFAKDMDFSQEVGKNIIIVGENENLLNALKAEGFGVLSFDQKEIQDINGHLGNLDVELVVNDKLIEVKTDQIVWENAPEFALKQSGVLDICDESIQEVVEKIVEKTGNYAYKNFIFYDKSICQYHERREEICGKCAEVCPTVAIVKLDKQKHLQFSHIDCHGCGGCISVCPSGALDYSQMPSKAFYEISKMYKDRFPLIVPRKMFDENPKVELKKGVLPLAIEGEKYLHEAHFMTLLQESGMQILFYTDFVSKGTKDAINIVNQIYKVKYKMDAILVAKNSHELKSHLENLQKIPDETFTIFSENLTKREVFAKRLSHLVDEKNLGIIKSGEHVRYGDVKVDEDKCTLCVSCVDACNVGALSADKRDNSLKLNASICTTCGYCEATCPESGCMEVVRGEIPLKPDWFEKRTLAKDTLFECIVCHKPFATTKSVQKIANMMTPIFGDDKIKIKSLYCCADCKPKVMFEDYLQQ